MTDKDRTDKDRNDGLICSRDAVGGTPTESHHTTQKDGQHNEQGDQHRIYSQECILHRGLTRGRS